MNAKMMKGRKVVFGALIILLALIPQFVTAAETCEERENALQQAVTVQDYEQFIAENSPCELAFVAVQRLASGHVNDRDWKAAADIYKKYKADFPVMAERFDMII
ncbi:MAG: hypothetical protein JRF05_00085, partial [Deltaproteobacteria bacterium]|nr:hypothetical protein [Deltaproteobacteria bacterium]